MTTLSLVSQYGGRQSRGLAKVAATGAIAALLLALAVLPVSAAPLGPLAVSGAASSVGSTSAVLSGSIDPRGTATNWYIEYGTTQGYGSKTATMDAGAGDAAVAVATSISGLTPSTTYHFRFIAVSSAGTGEGADTAFMTALVVPSATTIAATSVSNGHAKLRGSVNPNGQSTVAYFVYGPTTAYGSRTPAQSVGSATSPSIVSFAVGGLTEDTTYHYEVIASNPVGTSVGSDVSFITSGLPTVATGAVTSISTSGATLSGSVGPDGHSTSWFFQYGTSVAYGAKTPTKSVGSGHASVAVDAALKGLQSSTVEHFRLVAVNSAGTTAGPDSTFATLGPTLTPTLGVITYGHSTMLTGTIPNDRADEIVNVFEQRISDPSSQQMAAVLTGPGGVWALSARPLIETTYRAVWDGEVSPPSSVAVQPSLRIHGIQESRFQAGVKAARSFRGRVVQLQRLDRSGWTTIARARLDRTSTAVFDPQLPKGGSRLRIAISASQAGAGYSAAASAAIVFRR